MTQLPEVLLRRRTITEAGCWEWSGCRDRRGYGKVRIDKTLHRVHRLVCHLVHGLDLADPMEFALHECDNPPCFNPNHLRPGTARDNMLDRVERTRVNFAPPKNGRAPHLPPIQEDRLCGKGLHRMTADNIYYSKDGAPNSCRACQQERAKRRKERLRVERFGL